MTIQEPQEPTRPDPKPSLLDLIEARQSAGKNNKFRPTERESSVTGKHVQDPTPIFDELNAESQTFFKGKIMSEPLIRELASHAVNDVAPPRQKYTDLMLLIRGYQSPGLGHVINEINAAIAQGLTTVHGDPFDAYVRRASVDSGDITYIEQGTLLRAIEKLKRQQAIIERS
jgi:hypothetical protein